MQFTKALQHTIGWKALNTMLIFLINVLLVRILGVEESGGFFYSIALLSFIILIISGSMESGINYYGSKNTEDLSTIILFLIPFMLVQAIICWILLHYVPIKLNRQFSWIFILSNIIIIYFSALYFAKKWFISINIIPIIVNLIILIGLGIIYIKYGNENFSIIKNYSATRTIEVNHFTYYIYLGGFLLQAFSMVIFFVIFTGFKISFKVRPLLISNIFRYSSIAFLSNILFFLVTRIDYFFVQEYTGEVALSNYVQVSKIGQLLILLPSMMASVIFPFSSVNYDKIYLGKVQFLCRIVSFIFIGIIFIVVLFGFWLFPILFGNGFALMYPAMLFYLPGFYCLGMVTMLAAYIAGRGLVSKNMIASGISLIAVIVGDLFLIPLWGINAAAAVSSFAYFLCLIYLLKVHKNIIDCYVTDFFIIKRSDLQLVIERINRIIVKKSKGEN